jgi:acetylglutamate kinase
MNMKKLHVIKIGGNIIDDDTRLRNFLLDFSHLRGHKILVHGGGKTASEISSKLGIETVMNNGRRITDAQTLKVVTMVYAGTINKKIVSCLQSNNCNAIGLSGADANIITAIKRPVKEIDFGFVGDVSEETVNVTNLLMFLEMNMVPVIAPLTHDKKGNLLNTNADNIASALAIAFSKVVPEVKLIYCFDKKGVMKDLNDDSSLIPCINGDNYSLLKSQGTIQKGMVPKLDNAFNAVQKGVSSVRICNAEQLLNTVNTPKKIGTELTV